ncbi:MAG: peptidase T [Tannerella sp.]|jgi:tripeptide aminopeptidase|nr:peptidase T [Tannerella sp.]
MDVKELFMKYVTFDTQSDEKSGKTPSSDGQWNLARELVNDLKTIGLEDISLDENCYVMATLPANTSCCEIPAIGFIAHLDTSPDMSGGNVNPRTINYLGGDIALDAGKQVVLSPAMFPEMNDYIGRELIVTDGTTLLGADDKAGIAAIVSAMGYLKQHDEIAHGKIGIAFTPDEEIGCGANHFDVDKFGCRWAYTVDGGAIGELEYENFNAAVAVITVKGRNVHPGTAKNKMLNASLIAIDLINRLPADQRPENTDGYEGFYHLISFTGSVEEAKLTYLIRDHDRKLFEDKKQLIISIIDSIKKETGASVSVEIRDQYYNMREKVEPHKDIIDIAVKAMEACGVKPLIKPVRGGTDGARLSFKGLPCPNIFTGGINFHGRYEFLPVYSLEKCMETIVNITRFTYEHYKPKM